MPVLGSMTAIVDGVLTLDSVPSFPGDASVPESARIDDASKSKDTF